jgi:hypothetical protein
MSFTGFGCTKIVGFLFPHRCGRLSTVDCPYCSNPSALGADNYFMMRNHPYKVDRAKFPDFGVYDSSQWAEVIEFTKGDGASLQNQADFEMDFGAS